MKVRVTDEPLSDEEDEVEVGKRDELMPNLSWSPFPILRILDFELVGGVGRRALLIDD